MTARARISGALELYSGLGGFAAAANGAVEVRASLDVDAAALAIAAANFDHPHVVRNLEAVSADELAAFGAELWWMSPPCQPFTRRGRGRDDEDPRTASLLGLVEAIGSVRPPAIAMENVPPFAASRTRGRLVETLEDAGYLLTETILCPTELGVPNRRRRYYLVASRSGPIPLSLPESPAPRPLHTYLDPSADQNPSLRMDPDLLARYDHAVDRVDPRDDRVVASTFTSAYGRSPVRSGSYLRCDDGGWRRFAPREILRLLGFPDAYRLPPDLPLRRAWHLVGNTLSVPAVRVVLGALGISEPT